MKIRSFIFVLMLACTLPFALSACDRDGPAEEAGESVDQATERTGEAIEDTTEQMEERTEGTQERTEGMGERTEPQPNY